MDQLAAHMHHDWEQTNVVTQFIKQQMYWQLHLQVSSRPIKRSCRIRQLLQHLGCLKHLQTWACHCEKKAPTSLDQTLQSMLCHNLERCTPFQHLTTRQSLIFIPIREAHHGCNVTKLTVKHLVVWFGVHLPFLHISIVYYSLHRRYETDHN